MSRLYSTQKYKGFYDKNKTKQKNYFFMTFLQKTLAFFKNLCYNSCVRKFAKMNMEAYRSGHNGTDSKSVVPHGTVGSNPTASANARRTFGCAFCVGGSGGAKKSRARKARRGEYPSWLVDIRRFLCYN